MAYARPFGQQQAASPWSAGVPPGLQQQPQQQQAQQMFSQPMGAFDLSGAWQGQQQQAPPMPQVAGQWAQQMQAPVQFVPNSAAYIPQQPMPMHQQPHHQHQQQRYHQQQQKSMHHQRSLSAPRIGGAGGQNRRAGNQNNSFGGNQRQHNNNNNNNSNDNQVQQQRTTRQTARQGNQKVQFSNNNNNNNSSSNNNARQQNQPKQQQHQQQQQQSKTGPVKVTKAAKKQAIVKANSRVNSKTDVVNKNNNSNKTSNNNNNNNKNANVANQQAARPQSKTAERKQMKVQARKNAEALTKSKMPVVKSTKGTDGRADVKEEAHIDQAQLKCVPAVFGFVCKACDVFLRDRVARREHIESDDHLQKFKVFEVEQQKEAAASKDSEGVKVESVTDSSVDTSESAEIKPDEASKQDKEEEKVEEKQE